VKTWNFKSQGEKGYPWFSWSEGLSSRKPLLALLVVIVTSGLFAGWYLQTGLDPAPDSVVGYIYAFVGTGFFLAALIAYTRKRQSHHRIVGQLNAALNWHTVFGLLGLFFLVLHSFGNLNPRSGTYALYGMIALAISGIAGRVLDRILPRLAANEVQRATTAQGEDRVDAISHQLETISAQGASRPRQLVRLPSPESTYWLGDPDSVPEIIEMQSLLGHHTAENIHALRKVEQSVAREHLYRYMIRYWRLFHKLLALTTVALTIWHLVYAIQLLTGL
jgi:hypothetical protein